MSHTRQEQMEAFGRFLDILDELRVKCPWDRKQTNESLRPNTIEETYELCDALMREMTRRISVKSWEMSCCTSLSMPRSARKQEISTSRMFATSSATN